MKKIFVLVLLLVLVFAGSSYAGDYFYGVSFFSGDRFPGNDPIWHDAPKGEKRNEYQISPLVGIHITNRWDTWVEGKIGLIDWELPDELGGGEKDAFKLGALIMTSYDVLKFRAIERDVSLYTEIGVGVAYMTYSPNQKILNSHSSPMGLIDYGAGVKVKLDKNLTAKAGLRFEHTSSLPGKDVGINTYQFLVGLQWK